MINITDKDYDLILRYHSYELSDKEMQAVLNRMDKDPEFETLVLGFDKFKEALRSNRKKNQQQQTIQEWKKLTQTNKPQPKIGAYKYLRAIAAVFLLVIATCVVFYTLYPPVNALEYTTSQIENEVNNLSLIAERGEAPDSLLKIAYDAYEKGETMQVISLLRMESDSSSQQEDAQLFLGKIYLQEKEWASAINTLEPFKTSKQSRDIILWLQALAFVQNNQLVKARENLSLLIEEDYPIKKEAAILLDKIGL